MIRILKLFALLFILFGSISFAQDTDQPLKLDLKIVTPSSGEFMVGEPVQAELSIKNVTDHAVNIIPPLDGSCIFPLSII